VIAPELIADIQARLEGLALGPSAAEALGSAYPGLRITWCSDDDVDAAKPVAEGEGFRLYLVDGSSHCMGLTRDYADAVGVVVAEVFDEEE